jgi:integrase
MDRYGEEVACFNVPAKRKSTITKIRYFKNRVDLDTKEKSFPIMSVLLMNLSKNDFIQFRDKRLTEVGEGTFLREWSLFNVAMNIAAGEWGWIHKNCMRGIRKPKEPEHRKRRPTNHEIQMISYNLGYSPDRPVTTIRQRVAAAFLFAIETAMRASEVTCLKTSEVFLSEGYIKVTGEELTARKTRSAVRNVPLTAAAKNIIKQMYKAPVRSEFLFGTNYTALNLLFREAVKASQIYNLHFHDARHEGTTRLAKIYKVLDLANIIGHKDIHELITYYNPTIEELVASMPSTEA